MRQGRLRVGYSSERTFTYHDPCELGRGSGIYDEPRAVIEAVGVLAEPDHTRKDALCCGSSVANTVINDAQQLTIAQGVARELDDTGADTVVTSCPLCKKADRARVGQKCGRSVGDRGRQPEIGEILLPCISTGCEISAKKVGFCFALFEFLPTFATLNPIYRTCEVHITIHRGMEQLAARRAHNRRSEVRVLLPLP